MKILNIVFSKGRADNIGDLTLSWLPLVDYDDYLVVVEPQDWSKYLAVLPKDALYQLPKNDQGLGYAKNIIREYALKNRYDAIFKLDDDIIGWAGQDRKLKKGKACVPVFNTILKDCCEAFEKHPDVQAVGFPYSFEMYEVRKWIGVNLRLQSNYLCRTKYFVGDPRVKLFEDFHNYLYIRANQGITLRYGYAGQGMKPVGKFKGGTALLDRKQQAEENIKIFRELYPALKAKKVTDKPWQLEPDMRGPWFGVKYFK